jgi:hypothetical protein
LSPASSSGWSKSARPQFEIYTGQRFSGCCAKLSRRQVEGVLDLAKALENDGRGSTDLSFEHPAHGLVLGRFSDGVFILFRDKPYGPRTYELVGCGTFARLPDGSIDFQGFL